MSYNALTLVSLSSLVSYLSSEVKYHPENKFLKLSISLKYNLELKLSRNLNLDLNLNLKLNIDLNQDSHLNLKLNIYQKLRLNLILRKS